ncbi:cytochrome P450 [Dentipellis sp. KUC8613]|nr:cytochrome P450 [Dentipellis sp. KUC8613]
MASQLLDFAAHAPAHINATLADHAPALLARINAANPVDLALLALAAILVARWSTSGTKPKGPLPPGPRGYPLVGMALSLPSVAPWRVYQRWARDLKTDMLWLRLPSTGPSLLILSSAEAATDLLVKRSTVYSDRPQSIMLSDLMGMSWVFGLMQYGDDWKQHRKLFHREFELSGAVRPHELAASRRLLNRLLKQTVNYQRDMQLTTGDMILSATYGITPKSENDDFIKLAESLVGAMAVVAGGGFLVDMLPALRRVPAWFPGGGFKKQAAEWMKLGVKARSVPFEHVQTQMAEGKAPPSVASHFLSALTDEADPEQAKSKEQMQNILAEAYLGGAGATVGTLCTFILAMSLNPHLQKRAQAQLDALLSTTSSPAPLSPHARLPTFADAPSLPYVDALVAETLRWHPGAPLGLFHAAARDDVYQGKVIPKGTMVTANVWAILHDERVYGAQTERYRPERFLGQDGKRNGVPEPEWAFGFGRRVCPGRVMGRETLWITAASILACFDISAPVDKDGKPLDEATIEYSNSMSSRPPYFDVTFTLRHPGLESVIVNGLQDQL